MTVDTVVIGAGWAGLSAATVLDAAGRDVIVIEKARGPGGRSATRRTDHASFDLGAQYFTVRNAAFGRQVQQWRDLGLVQPWKPRLAVFGDRPASSGSEEVLRFVGVPGMSSICRHMVDQLSDRQQRRWQTRVERLEFDGLWHLELGAANGDEPERISARRLLITAPPAQAAALLGLEDPLHETLAAVRFDPCITAMLSFDEALDTGLDAAFVNLPGALSWIARNSSKPGRRGENWVLHGTGDWSRGRLEQPLDELAVELSSALSELLDKPLPSIRHRSAHRWRYAQAQQALDIGLIEDPERRLAIAGDWLAGSRIEGAWTSGLKAGRWLAQVD